MKPCKIKNANVASGAPAGWDPKTQGDCGALPIHVYVDRYGNQCCVSAWKPSAEELATLCAGGYVTLDVVGWQVPVMLDVVGEDGADE